MHISERIEKSFRACGKVNLEYNNTSKLTIFTVFLLLMLNVVYLQANESDIKTLKQSLLRSIVSISKLAGIFDESMDDRQRLILLFGGVRRPQGSYRCLQNRFRVV